MRGVGGQLHPSWGGYALSVSYLTLVLRISLRLGAEVERRANKEISDVSSGPIRVMGNND